MIDIVFQQILEKEGNGPKSSACPDQFFVTESLVMRRKSQGAGSFILCKAHLKRKSCCKEDGAFVFEENKGPNAKCQWNKLHKCSVRKALMRIPHSPRHQKLFPVANIKYMRGKHAWEAGKMTGGQKSNWRFARQLL